MWTVAHGLESHRPGPDSGKLHVHDNASELAGKCSAGRSKAEGRGPASGPTSQAHAFSPAAPKCCFAGQSPEAPTRSQSQLSQVEMPLPTPPAASQIDAQTGRFKNITGLSGAFLGPR